MVELLYADTDEKEILFEENSAEEIAQADIISNSINELHNTTKLSTYVHLDGGGIDLYNTHNKLYENGDYVGWISKDKTDANGNMAYTGSLISFQFKKPIESIEIFFKGFDKFKGYLRYFDITYGIKKGNTYEEIRVLPNISAVNTPKNILISRISTEANIISLSNFRNWEENSHIKIERILVKYIDGEEETIKRITDVISADLIEEISYLSDNMPVSEFNCKILAKPKVQKQGIASVDVNEGGFLSIYSANQFYGTYRIEEKKYEYKVPKELERNPKTNDVLSLKARNAITYLEKFPTPDLNIVKAPYGRTELYSSLKVSIGDFVKAINTACNKEILKLNGVTPDEITIWEMFKLKDCRYTLANALWSTGLYANGCRTDGKVILQRIPQKIASSYIDENRILGSFSFEKKVPINEIKIKALNDLTNNEKSTTLKSDGDGEIELKSPIYGLPSGATEANTVLTPTKLKMPVSLYENGFPTTQLDGNGIVYLGVIFDNSANVSSGTEELNTFSSSSNQDEYFGDTPQNFKEKIFRYMTNKGKLKGKFIVHNEQVGDFVKVDTTYDGIQEGIITKMTTHFGYKDVADVEIMED